ncbi:MAG: hypothetical protein Q9226_008079 [Calogaya cf. arnoldii]
MKHSLDSGNLPTSKRQKVTSSEKAQLNRQMSSMSLESSFPFLRLPGELRNQIYELCLVVDGTINPYPAQYQDNLIVPKGQSKPSVALLRVSKLVKAEAQPILYGRNTWLHNQTCTNYGQPHGNFKRQPFWDNFKRSRLTRPQIGHVIIAFSFQELNREELQKLYTTWALTKAAETSPIPVIPFAHFQIRILMYDIWFQKVGSRK